MSKGQLITTDFAVGSMIFIVLITVILFALYTYPIRLDDEQNKNEMLLDAFQISDTFIKTPGAPSSWEANVSNLRVIGLAESDRVLSREKVDALTSLEYNKAKQILSFYDFYFRLIDSNDNVTAYGKAFNGTNSVIVRRYVIYENNPATIEITIWK